MHNVKSSEHIEMEDNISQCLWYRGLMHDMESSESIQIEDNISQVSCKYDRFFDQDTASTVAQPSGEMRVLRWVSRRVRRASSPLREYPTWMDSVVVYRGRRLDSF